MGPLNVVKRVLRDPLVTDLLVPVWRVSPATLREREGTRDCEWTTTVTGVSLVSDVPYGVPGSRT